MMLFTLIDKLLIGTRYLAWGIGALGLLVSIALGVANFSVGMSAVLLCVAGFLFSLAVSLILLPKSNRIDFFPVIRNTIWE